ncbi:MAG: hypothetical protein ABH852_00205 [Methanobacteriota archaeon]
MERIEAIRDERSPILMAVFVNGFAAGWKMAVGEAFKDAIDIKLTQKMVGGKKQMVWTQGRIFNFKQGDTIHDVHTPFSVWREAMEHLALMVQVIEASPSVYVSQETIIIEGSINARLQKPEGQPKEKVLDGLTIDRQRFSPGFIRFELYLPNEDRSTVKKAGVYETTQEDFIVFLQTGVVRTKDNEVHDLTKRKD